MSEGDADDPGLHATLVGILLVLGKLRTTCGFVAGIRKCRLRNYQLCKLLDLEGILRYVKFVKTPIRGTRYLANVISKQLVANLSGDPEVFRAASDGGIELDNHRRNPQVIGTVDWRDGAYLRVDADGGMLDFAENDGRSAGMSDKELTGLIIRSVAGLSTRPGSVLFLLVSVI